MIKFVQHFWRSDKGTTAIEYGLITALVVVLLIGAFQALGNTIVTVFYDKIASAL